MQKLLAVCNFITTNWPLISGLMLAASSAVATMITSLTNHPEAETWLHRVQGALSWAEHADIGGFKAILKRLTPPVKGQPVLAPPPKGLVALWFSPALLALALAGLMCGGCATMAWGVPVVYSGPSAGVETSVNLKTGAITEIGAGACYSVTIGDGEFEWVGHTWDAIDLSGMGCGGSVGAGNASGSLQVGGKIGTLNGIGGIAVLYPVLNTGGAPAVDGTLVLSAMVDLQAIVANFTNAATHLQKVKQANHEAAAYPLPRGGLVP